MCSKKKRYILAKLGKILCFGVLRFLKHLLHNGANKQENGKVNGVIGLEGITDIGFRIEKP